MEIWKRRDIGFNMKGISLSLSMIVILIVAALVLSALIYFFMFQTTQQMTKSEANRIFYTECQKYKERKCDWSVTYDTEFDKFLDACKFLFGQDHDKFSCLYSLCQECKKLELDEIKCAGMCEICNGHKNVGVELENCCNVYKDECKSGCDICKI
ncbi:MAG: hypothetical protein QXD48_00975 [Candidatus Aenigmatarchaeota archaeon]